jgi:hypothetical protein
MICLNLGDGFGRREISTSSVAAALNSVSDWPTLEMPLRSRVDFMHAASLEYISRSILNCSLRAFFKITSGRLFGCASATPFRVSSEGRY